MDQQPLLLFPALGVDAEDVVLLHIPRHDRYILRQLCKSLRTRIGGITRRLVLLEDDACGAFLASLELDKAFPGVKHLVLRASASLAVGWFDRFRCFVTSPANIAVLQQLQKLDLGTEYCQTDWGVKPTESFSDRIVACRGLEHPQPDAPAHKPHRTHHSQGA